MTGATHIPVPRAFLEKAAELARQCSSAAVRERVLVSRAIALAVREHIRNTLNLDTQEGCSGSSKFLELLDICDFQIKGWHVESRAIINAESLALYVPTMPLMVGILSDFYLCAQTNASLTSATLLGYARRADLAESELSANGLFAILPAESLRPFERLVDEVKDARPDPNQMREFEQWQERAHRIMRAVEVSLAAEDVFSSEQRAQLAGGLRDDILRIYGKQIPETGLEPLFNMLFRRFGIEPPVPSSPHSPVAFKSRIEDQSKFKAPEERERFFQDGLTVGERVSFYRYLLEDDAALEHHRVMKRILDRATAGKHHASPRRRAKLRAQRELRAESLSLEPPLRSDSSREIKEPPALFAAMVSLPAHYGSLPEMDFSSDPETVRVVAEGERLSYGHLFNPAFATEISLIDPLPHQRIAVYEQMLKQSRLRFLLADDAGAGKTIMAGLYIREMLARRLIQRVLIVPPAGLVGNWEREMNRHFSLPFRVITGGDIRYGNPFTQDGNLLIVSLDTLAGDRMFAELQASVAPYDLVIFDEAHKLSANREPDFTIRKTDRYRLAESLAGIQSDDPRWRLDWSCHHLILLTATPHMGKDFPYFCLWRLLDPEALSTLDAFNAYPKEARARHFIRRTKEEMVRYDGTPIYPKRISDTLSYDLTQGEVSEQRLYDETTSYINHYYNRARILNRSAARLAMSVFQRRLASSTYALLRSFERRLEKLDSLIDDIRSGRLDIDGLQRKQRNLDDETSDVLDEKTADEEGMADGGEEHEAQEERAMGSVVAVSLAELQAERLQVQSLLSLARQVYETYEESKFEKLREILGDPKYKDEKIIIFTEHRDTLDFLTRRLEGLGLTGHIARIHGGMDYRERDEMVAFFRKKVSEGGAKILVATDAAGEGINLQFCWLMVNYDIPWNPARLEQRMGRIHRYGQQHDPVVILNLVAGKTREGRVLKTLLEKLERIRREMGSDKVFDVIGRLFEGVSLKAYMEEAVTEEGAGEVEKKLEWTLTREQVEALEEKEKRLIGEGGEVKSELPRLNASLEQETYRRLLPGYVRRFVEKAAPLMNIAIEGNTDDKFSLKPLSPGALDPLLPILETYSSTQRSRLTFFKPGDPDECIWIHPGEPLFDYFNAWVCSRFANHALRGAVFTDPTAKEPYLFHLALISVERKPDPALKALAQTSIVEYRLAGIRHNTSGHIEECPVEHLLLLKGGGEIPSPAIQFASAAGNSRDVALSFALEHIARPAARQSRESIVASLPEREDFIRRGYDYQAAELALARTRFTERARAGDSRAKGELTKIKERQRKLDHRREESLSVVRREPELIIPGGVIFLAHALVVPSTEPEDKKRHDERVEQTAVRAAWAYEEARGAVVKDVSTPALAAAAGQPEHPGFDLLSNHPDGETRAIEVKGRAGVGDVELTENEWIKACNLRDRYWLYVVYDCASLRPRVLRVQDPFGKLIAKAKGSVIIDDRDIFDAAEKE